MHLKHSKRAELSATLDSVASGTKQRVTTRVSGCWWPSFSGQFENREAAIGYLSKRGYQIPLGAGKSVNGRGA